MIETSLTQQAAGMPRSDVGALGHVDLFRSPTLERLSRIGRHLFDMDLCLLVQASESHWIQKIGDIATCQRHGAPHSVGRHGAVIVEDLRAFPESMMHPMVVRDPAIRFIAWVDLQNGGAGIPVTLVLGDREPRAWTADTLDIFDHFVDLCIDTHRNSVAAQDVIALSEENRQLRKLATVDRMTGLWNRESIFDIFEREIERCGRQGLPISVIVADLDHFKRINDRHGHLAGDAVLKEVAGRLRSSVRSYDAIGRVGGEEFLIVMSDCSEWVAASIAERIQHLVRKDPVVIHNLDIPITISQGLVTYSGQDKKPAVVLFDLADRALYLAKSRGRDGIQRDTDLPTEIS